MNSGTNLPVIAGIQQVGIGVVDAEEAWRWYRRYFGMNIPIFKDQAAASLMTRYTGNHIEERYAILAINSQGGGGFEIWQYTSRKPKEPHREITTGDAGINAIKIKTRNVDQCHAHFIRAGIKMAYEIQASPDGRKHFFVRDPYHNLFQVVDSKSWLSNSQCPTGGVSGAIVGVSDMTTALILYQKILGYQHLVYDQTGVFNDLKTLAGGQRMMRRILLRNYHPVGVFSKLLGTSELELIQLIDEKPNKTFEMRHWGDLGFIHLCYDVHGMDQLSTLCSQHNLPFTVDSRNSFDMGKASGHFSYVEDPDGTLIEFVETHKIPLIEKVGLYLNLTKRDPCRPLPAWILSMLSLGRVKN